MRGHSRLLTLSAPTPAVLERATDALAQQLDTLDDAGFAQLPDVPDVPVSMQQCVRRATVANSAADAARRLRRRDPRRVFTGGPGTRQSPVFLCSGVGDQYPGLGSGLHRCLPAFRREVDRCIQLLAADHGLDLRPVLFPPDTAADPTAVPGDGRPDLADLFDRKETTGEIHRTVTAQPLMFVLQYALARALTSLGARPAALAGYSVGEYAAACVAGVFPLADALHLVTRRARLVDALPAGAMLTVAAGVQTVRPYLAGPVSLAALNGPEQTVLSGPVEAMEEAAQELTAAGVACRRLATSHAFHSAMTRPLTEPLEELLAGMPLRPPDLPMLSNVTGTWLRDDEATNPAHWARQLSRTIRFADQLAELWRLPGPLLIELGPGQTLARLALQHPSRPADATAAVVQTLPGQFESRTERELLLTAVGRLWTAGMEIDWPALRGE
ncbi:MULTISPECIES: acyltransferase domain-containing protein [unclassified Streptomyces]|uniref:acyltransferase domain-containing protein n=1 Tax=unclassified Streptomyces TaxID=2593676 RepID=UPI002365842F|nr:MULTISPECIES: acyltransferase domain-containing protein [unclassified Streptomyces]MDF3142966.1 acyltransferase domain-containing protein [Streptomyces sp. T21Q-yed]WDF42882.1 acyltransferase domain-containing protein [Streptomyces sp. T12]